MTFTPEEYDLARWAVKTLAFRARSLLDRMNNANCTSLPFEEDNDRLLLDSALDQIYLTEQADDAGRAALLQQKLDTLENST